MKCWVCDQGIETQEVKEVFEWVDAKGVTRVACSVCELLVDVLLEGGPTCPEEL